MTQLSVLLLADYTTPHATTVTDHIEALRSRSRHDVRLFNPRDLSRTRALRLEEFDAVVLHYSIVAIHDAYLPSSLRQAIRRFSGLKIQIIQDDYRWVNAFTQNIKELGITVLFTLVPEREMDNVWDPHELPGVERINTLAGYAPLEPARFPRLALADRPFDIVYRGRALPYWLGRLGQEKAWIAQGVLERAESAGLRVDVDWRESARVYGGDWIRFLVSGRATLGTESGSSITDFDGTLQRMVDEYVGSHPDATYEEVHRTVLEPYEGNVRMNVVSPRIFEAAAARTALVLFPGEYSGAVVRDEHYIGLEKDFSNWNEVVSRLRDTAGLEAMVERAYEDLIASGRFDIGRFVEQFDEVVGRRCGPPRSSGIKPRHRLALVERPARLQAGRVKRAVLPPVLRWHAFLNARRHQGRRLGWLDAPLKAGLAMRLAAHDDRLQAVLRAFARGSLRSRALVCSPARLLDDLLKLGVMRRLQNGDWPGSGFVDFELEVRENTLTARTCLTPVVSPSPRAPQQVTRLMWDHRAVGTFVPCPVPAVGRALRIAIGYDGVHEFQALAAILQHDPQMLAAVFGDERPNRNATERHALLMRSRSSGALIDSRGWGEEA